MTLTTLPTDSFISAAFEELISDTQSLFESAVAAKPIDKDEVKFWRSQRAAFVNAQGDWLSGLRPVATESGYILRSASVPGQTHRAWKVGGIWTCSCKAGDRGIFHRHTALINVIERAAEMENEARKDAELVRGGGSGHTPEAAAQLLEERLEATAQLIDAMRAAQHRAPVISLGSRIARVNRAYLEAA